MTPLRIGEHAMTDSEGFLLPHVRTFSAIYNTFSKVYSRRWDEAVRMGQQDADRMNRDAFIRALIQERIAPLTGWKWEIEADPDENDLVNPKDPYSADREKIGKHLKAGVKRTRGLIDLRRYLALDMWFGRYGSQLRWEKQKVVGTERYVVGDHKPIDGDKIAFGWDGTPGVMVRPGSTGGWPDVRTWDGISQLAMLSTPAIRQRFIISKYFIEDAGYLHSDMAGRVEGIGYRDYSYFGWALRKEMLVWLIDFMQKVGNLGLLIVWYDESDPKAKEKAEATAKAASGRNAIAAPRTRGNDKGGAGVELIPANMAGVEFLTDVITDYCERHLERLIVGQSMSSGRDKGDGLGGTGRADFAKDTKFHLLKWDAEKQAETLTCDLITPARDINFPGCPWRYQWVYALPDPEAKDKLDAITKAAGIGGQKLKYKASEVRGLTGMTKPDDGDEVVGGEEMPQPGDPMGGLSGQPAGAKQLGSAQAGLSGQPAGQTDSPDDAPAPGMGELVAAMVHAAADGDWQTVRELRLMGMDRSAMAGFLDDLGSEDGPEKDFTDHPLNGIGDAVLDALGVKKDEKSAKAGRTVSYQWGGESKVHRDSGKFSQTDGQRGTAGKPGSAPTADPTKLAAALKLPEVKAAITKLAEGAAIIAATVNAKMHALGLTPDSLVGDEKSWTLYFATANTDALVRALHIDTLTAYGVLSYVAAHALVQAKQFVASKAAGPRQYAAWTRMLTYEWSAGQTKSGHLKAVWSGEGQRRDLYGERARQALAAHQRGEPEQPPNRLRGAARQAQAAKPGWDAIRDQSRPVIQKALTNPESVHPDELPELALRLTTMTRDELRAMAKELDHRTGGRLKREIMVGLIAHVKTGRSAADAAGGVQDGPSSRIPTDAERRQSDSEWADQHRKQEQLDAANAHAERMAKWVQDKPWAKDAADASQTADLRVQGARDRLDPTQPPPKRYPERTADEWEAERRKAPKPAGPVRVFHGTSSEFKDFNTDKAGSNLDAGFFGKGSYFTTNPELAKSYARKGKGLEPNAPRALHHVDLDLTNPYDFGRRTPHSGTRGETFGMHERPGHGIPKDDGLRDAVYKRADLTPVGPDDEPRPEHEPKLAQALRDELIARGHDGAVSTHPDGSKEYVAFHGHAATIKHTEPVDLADGATSPPPPTDPPTHRADGTPHAPRVEDVHTVPTKSLVRKPEMMQYKVSGIGEGGVTDELKGVKKYNPELGGTLLAWRHPETGEDIVVNGHHRHELADRTGAETVNARYIQAPDAKTARARGALNNIAEGRGTATDAAKYLRDTGSSADDFREAGVSLSGKVAADALHLKDLGEKPFQRLTEGRLDEGTAVAVARHLKDPALQDVLFKKLDDRNDEGKDWSTRQIERAAQKMAKAGTVTKTGTDLFGSFEEQHPTFEQEVELEEHVVRQLGQKVNDFAAVSNAGRAERVKDAGNQLAIEENQKRRKAAEDEAATFDVQQDRVGPVSAAVKAAAAELATAKTRKERDAIKARTVEAVRDAIARHNADPFAVATDAGGAEGRGAGREADHGAPGGGPDAGQAPAQEVTAPPPGAPAAAPAVPQAALAPTGSSLPDGARASADTGHPVVDELTYRSYRQQRLDRPDIAPERWGKLFAGAADLEARFQEEQRKAPLLPAAREPLAVSPPPPPSSFLGPNAQLDIFGGSHRAPRPSPAAVQPGLIPQDVERRADVEHAEEAFAKIAAASNPDDARPNHPPDFHSQFHAAHAAADHGQLHDLIGTALRGEHGPDVKKQVGDAITANADAAGGLADKYRRVAEAVGHTSSVEMSSGEAAPAPEPPTPGQPSADPVSEPTSPVAHAEEQADEQDKDPRERAAATAKATDPDYEFARSSSVPNAGEDLKGSARHKVNAWRGLADAEANGTAEELVTRDNLLKAEPHTLMATVAPENATAHLAAHVALNAFPAAPFAAKEYDDYHRAMTRQRESNPDMPEPTSKEALRAQYYEAFTAIRGAAETLARNGGSPEAVVRGIHGLTESLMKRYRDTRPNRYNVEVPHDRWNPVANALADLYDRTRIKSYKYKATDVMNRVNDFASRVKAAYPDMTADAADRVAEHVKDVIEGHSFNKTFGTVGSGPKRFDPATLYVKHARRKGGRVIDANTVQTGTKFVTGNLKMRGLQWGNSVTDDERVHHLTKTAEALADLADITGLPDDAMSFGGKLGLAIGARGKGNALAHYEPDTKVINLTRKNGVGSLAHEWGHGLDHFLAGGEILQSREGPDAGYLSESTGEKTHVWEKEGGKRVIDNTADPVWKAMNDVRTGMTDSGFSGRLPGTIRDAIKKGEISESKEKYWKSGREVFARCFERYVQRKLAAAGRENTYLSGVDDHALWPSDAEVEAMVPSFDRLMATVRDRHFK